MARLEPRVRAMLRAYRDAKASSPRDHRALWDRIETSLDEGVPGPGLEPPSAPRPGWVAPVVVVTAVATATVVAVLGLGLGLGDRASPPPVPSSTPPPSAPSEPSPAAPSPPPLPPPPVEPDPASAAVAAPPLPSSPTRRAKPRGGRDDPAHDDKQEPTVDPLLAEMALIQRARRALQAGQAARALEVLDAHARAFAQGQMREDRRVLRIEALCAAGKAPQARAEARMFLRTFPDSAHASRVRAMCAAS